MQFTMVRTKNTATTGTNNVRSSRKDTGEKADLCPRENTLKRPTDSTFVKQAPPISRACTYTRSFVSTYVDGISLCSTTILHDSGR